MDNYSTYLDKLQLLADGSASPKDMSVWAEKEKLSRDDDSAPMSDVEYELLSALQISGALDENGNYLYGQEDFRAWYDDFRSKVQPS